MTFTDQQLLSILRFEGCEAEPPRVVAELENALGVVFPHTLKRIWAFQEESVIGSDGAFAEPSGFGLYALKTPHFEYLSSTIMEHYDLLFRNRNPKIVPIGGEGNGDVMVLDYRFREEPVVLKFDHEIGYRTDNPFYFLALNFDEYVDRGLPERREFYVSQDSELTEDALSKLMGFPAAETFAYRDRQRRYEQLRKEPPAK